MPPISPIVPLVGRRAEMASLNEAYESAHDGWPRFVLVGGETGIGKSRLVSEFAETVRHRGAVVIDGAAPAVSGPDLPYAPIVAALRRFAETATPQRLASLFPPEAELTRLLPQRGPAPDGSRPGPGAQLRLYEEFLGFLTAVTSPDGSPLVLVLEDLHWADASTRGLLAYLVGNMRSGRVLVLATYRSTDAHPSSPLTELLMELDRSDAVHQLYLDALSADNAHALVRSIVGAAVPDERVDRIAHRSGGSPLFIEKLATAAENESAIAPRSLVAFLQAAVGRLAPDAQSFVRLAAVAGAAAPASVLEAAAGSTGIELGAAVRAARDAGILAVASRPAGGDVYAYRHPILQEVVYAELPESERARLHGLIAQVMEGGAKGLQRLDAVTAIELARHWWAAGDVHRAYPALIAAAHAAEDMYAFPEAHHLYERALVLRKQGAEPEGPPRRPIGFRASPAARGEATELALATAQAASLAGQPERAVELLQAQIAGTNAPDGPMLARLGLYLWEAGRRPEALLAYQQAVERIAVTGGPEKSSVLRAAARAFLLAGQAAQALPLARRAVASAKEDRLDRDESSSLSTLAACLALTDDVGEAVRVLDQRRELESLRRRQSGIRPRPSRIVDLLSGYWSQATVLERAGQSAESASVALEGVQRARELGAQRGWGGLVGAAAVRELIELGRWAEADTLLSDLLGGPPSASGVSAELHAAAARLLTARGDFNAAAAHVEAAGDVENSPPRIRGAVALAVGELAVWSGQLSEASGAVSDALETIAPTSDRLLVAELLVLGLRSAADRAGTAAARQLSAERAAMEREAAHLNSQLLTLALGDGKQVEAGGRKLAALVATGAAEYERLTSLKSSQWLGVAHLWEQLHQPFQAAYARWRAAEAELAPPTSREGARRELAAAHASCLALGAESLRRAVEGLARRARIDLAAPKPELPERVTMPGSGAAPTLGLSPRELEVMMLVSEGWTNRRIGDALFITEKTAGHHVSNILSKLGVSSRVEAASVAIRAGIVQSPVIATAPVARTNNIEADDPRRLTRTLVFTDVVKSAALVEAIGKEAWRDVIAWHEGTLRSLFRNYSGTEVDHAGDGFFVVFADVIAGLDCAVAIQRTLADHRKQHGFAPRLRLGIHTCDVSKVGDEYRGDGVHEAARIAAAAGPDEILASSASLPPPGRYSALEPRMIDLGGLAAPTPVVSIRWQQE